MSIFNLEQQELYKEVLIQTKEMYNELKNQNLTPENTPILKKIINQNLKTIIFISILERRNKMGLSLYSTSPIDELKETWAVILEE